MQEAFYCVYLDTKDHPLGRHLITLGTVDSTLVSTREVFRGGILAGASSLVVAHNHRSGDAVPSTAGVRVIRNLWEAAGISENRTSGPRHRRRPKADPCGIRCYSFREAGLL